MRGYQLVIGHGYEFLVPATQVAAQGVKTRFAVSGADIAKPHIATLNFDLTEPSYQLGMLAAMLSKTGKIGFIGGEKIPSVTACFRGFRAGARSVNPHIRVAQAYTSWDQPVLSKSQAEAFIQQHIDVILHTGCGDVIYRTLLRRIFLVLCARTNTINFGCGRETPFYNGLSFIFKRIVSAGHECSAP